MDTSIPERPIFVGVDTHADTHHVAVVNEHGKKLTDREFPTTATGYAQIEQWLQTIGTVVRIGIEGTGSDGVDLAPAPTTTRPRHRRGPPPEPATTPSPGQNRHHRRLRRRPPTPGRLPDNRTQEPRRRHRSRPRAARRPQQRHQSHHRLTQRPAIPDHHQPRRAALTTAFAHTSTTARHLRRLRPRSRQAHRPDRGNRTRPAFTGPTRPGLADPRRRTEKAARRSTRPRRA